MRIKIILEVEADDLDWGRSSVCSVDSEVWGTHLDVDLDLVRYQGEVIDFVDTDKACEYLEFLYGEADQKDYAHA